MKAPERKVQKSKSYLWIVSSAFCASLIPAVIALVINLIWFLLFWKPFASWFPALFPISQYFWFPLLLVIINAGLLILRYNYENNQKRENLFTKFCITSLQLQNRGEIQRMYLKLRDTDDISKFSEQLQNLTGDVTTKLRMLELYTESLMLDRQSRPIILYTIGYVSLWLFVISVPFLYWGFYGKWYGLFGFLLVTWPLIAYIHGPAYPVNYYLPYEKSAFVLTDYAALVKQYENLNL